MHVDGRSAGEKRDLGERNAGRGGDLCKGQDGVVGEIDSRGVFEVDFRATCAGDDAVAGFYGEVRNGLLPAGGVMVPAYPACSAARDADISLNEAEADDLWIGDGRLWQERQSDRRMQIELWRRGTRIQPELAENGGNLTRMAASIGACIPNNAGSLRVVREPSAYWTR